MSYGFKEVWNLAKRCVSFFSHATETSCKNEDADYFRSVGSVTAAAFCLSTPPENY